MDFTGCKVDIYRHGYRQNRTQTTQIKNVESKGPQEIVQTSIADLVNAACALVA